MDSRGGVRSFSSRNRPIDEREVAAHKKKIQLPTTTERMTLYQ